MFDAAHVGRRVEYTDRDGNKHLGTIKGVIEAVKQADVQLDKHTSGRNFYVPFDMLRIVDEEEK